MLPLRTLLLLTVLLAARPTATPAPSATATPAPSATATPAPSATAIPTGTVAPSATAVPTATPIPSPTATPVPNGPQPGKPTGFCLNFGPVGGCIDLAGLLGTAVQAVVSWLTGGIDALVQGVAGLFTAVVRVDQWAGLASFLAFLQTAALGMAGSFLVFGILLQLRGLLWGSDAGAALVGVAMTARALEAALLIPAAVWLIGQILTLAQALSDLIIAHSGSSGGAQLVALAQTFLSLSNPLALLAGIVGAIVLILVVLIKLMSVAVLAWLSCVGCLALATWPLGTRLAARWLWNFVAVALWGVGWAIWFKIIAAVLADFTITGDPATQALVQPFVVVALLLFGYGIPRAVDSLLGAAVAGHGTGLAGFAVGLGAAVASRGASVAAGQLWGRLIK